MFYNIQACFVISVSQIVLLCMSEAASFLAATVWNIFYDSSNVIKLIFCLYNYVLIDFFYFFICCVDIHSARKVVKIATRCTLEVS